MRVIGGAYTWLTRDDTGVGALVLDMLRDLGWTVVEVEGLRVVAALVRGVGVILIRPDASDADLAEVTDRLLLDRPPAPRLPHR